MKHQPIVRLTAGALVFASLIASFGVSPAAAQSDCTCLLPAGSGEVGSVSSANPDVFVTGATGQQAAVAGTPLGSGSVVTTGPNGTAAINLGSGCRFSMAGSMSMQIVPQQGGLCVKVVNDSVATPGLDGGTVAAAGLAAGAGVVVSLGMLASVSQ